MGERPEFKLAGTLKKNFFILFVIVFLTFLYGFILGQFGTDVSKKLLGFSLLALFFTVIFWLQDWLLNSKLKKPELKTKIDQAILNPEEYNLAEFLDYEAAKSVNKTLIYAASKKLPLVSSTALLYFIFAENPPETNFILSRLLLSRKDVVNLLKQALKEQEKFDGTFVKNVKKLLQPPPKMNYSKEFQEVILDSFKIARSRNHSRIKIGDILSGLAKYDPLFKKILVDFGLKTKDVENLARWLEDIKQKMEERGRFWDYENLMRHGTLAKDWAAGYTVTLDRFSIDWTEIGKRRGLPEIIGHEGEVKAVERALSRYDINNVLLVGEPGTGRKSIIYALVQRSLSGQSLPEVNYKRIVELDLPGLLSQLETVEEVEAVIDTIFKEVISAGNIILVIDEFHNFVGGRLAPGMIDISGILPAYLRSPQFRIIAVSSFTGLHRYIEQVPSVLALFEKVEVSEISEKETMEVLENLIPFLEKKHKKFISYPAIRDVIYYSNRYFPNIPFPKKAMDLLDESVVYVVSATKDEVVLPRHVAWIVSEKIQIPVGEMEVKEKETLLNLEELIHKKIINQEEAVGEVSAALRRARAEVTLRSGPMGTFLFLGPTGVGKTETSKALSEIYFGSEGRMIRLDMSEFQSIPDIGRLIGSPGEEGLLTTKVKENPFSLILLDEIEKAHPNILNLFLQVLDEGRLTDGMGRRVDFKNTIIIATSNAGYQIILEAIKEKADFSKIKEGLLSHLFKEGIFRPEFINRFDGVIVFRPLTKENLLNIAELMLQKIKNSLKEKGIEFVITTPLKERIVELGYNPAFGARNMKRVIQDKVENILASALISGELEKGRKAEIDPIEFKLIIS